MKKIPLLFILIVSLPTLLLARQHPDQPQPQASTAPFTGKVVEYNLDIADTTVNYTGKRVSAIAVNGSIPAPTLRFTEGDSAVIHVHNSMQVETSVHWHGLLLPNIMDGVPYLTTPPIRPGMTLTYRFALKQSGTYWYHSHTMLQEQVGLYGGIVIEPRQKRYAVDDEVVVLFSDWTNEKPRSVMKNLRREDEGSEWYSFRKGYAQSLDKLLQHHAWGERLKAAFHRMPPMDVADVYYDRFLLDGRPRLDLSKYSPGQRVRVRFINGAASSYCYLQYGGGKLQIVAADGNDVEPVEVDRMLVGVAETYDFILTIPASGTAEFRATPEDVSGYASAYFGRGDTLAPPAIPKPNVWLMSAMMPAMAVNMPGPMAGMDMGGMKGMPMDKKKGKKKMQLDGMHDMHMEQPQPDTTKPMQMPGMHMDHTMQMGNMTMPDSTEKMKDMPPGMAAQQHTLQQDTVQNPQKGSMAGMDMAMESSQDNDTLVEYNYNMLRALHKTDFPASRPRKEYTLNLTGNMYRYVWSINNKVLSEADYIRIKKGDVVRFKMVNQTMMNHPMHLHGHFFRVLNSQGEYAPLKHTVDVPPMTTITIEFAADEEKDWFFHCHILYHLVSGMARIVHYEGSERNPIMQPYPVKGLLQEDIMRVFFGSIAAKSNMVEFDANYTNTKSAFRMEADANYGGQYEADLSYERYLTQWLRPFVGVTALREKYYSVLNGDRLYDQKFALPVVGVRYTLPFFIESELRVNAKGHVRLNLESDAWLLPRLFFGWRVNTDREYHLDLQYVLNKRFALTGGYDSRYHWGGGLLVRF
ncbi:multicopper oxidase domain-containing protein [Pontibacter chitinilyticus]|uniref:multicopper oxidase domain-containing protein n=1 Tax=Pontibacter chitinilyticus TaxID=2674989 RepID=UPI003218E9F0